MTTRKARAALCSVLVATTLGVSVPAHAETLVTRDPAGDVRHYDLSEGLEAALPGTELPDREDGDLRRATVRYGEHRIRMAFRFRDLRRSEPVLMLQGRLQFPSDGGFGYAEAVVTASEANRAGRARLTTRRHCTVEHRIRYRTDRATLSFPARCLGSPRWVRFNAWILGMDDRTDPSYFYSDHVFPVFGANDNAVERFTRRIRRPD